MQMLSTKNEIVYANIQGLSHSRYLTTTHLLTFLFSHHKKVFNLKDVLWKKPGYCNI